MSFDYRFLNDITNNLDGRRIPLNESQRREKQQNKLYPYIGANNILCYIDDYIFNEEILCIAEDGGSWGRNENCSFIINEKCWINNHAHVLTPKNGVELSYLKYYLNHTDLTKYITGTTRGKLTKSALGRIQIPLPLLETQKKIVAILDKADDLRRNDQKILEKYDQLAQSVFLEMFGDPVRNVHKLNLCTIRDLIEEVKYGTSAKASTQGEFKYLRMNNITYQGYWDLSNIKFINLEEKDKEKYLVRKGDLLFNRTNSKELVGKTGVFNLDEPMAIAGYLIRVRVNQLANPYFIWGYLNSKHGKMTLENMCKSIVGMANINAQELQDIKLLKPPIELQNKYAFLIYEIEKQKQLTQQSLQKSEDLFQSLLQRAFKGELVKHDEYNFKKERFSEAAEEDMPYNSK